VRFHRSFKVAVPQNGTIVLVVVMLDSPVLCIVVAVEQLAISASLHTSANRPTAILVTSLVCRPSTHPGPSIHAMPVPGRLKRWHFLHFLHSLHFLSYRRRACCTPQGK
jgi:hypothetical protein